MTVTPASGTVALQHDHLRVDRTTVITVTLVTNATALDGDLHDVVAEHGQPHIEADYSGDSNYLADSASMTVFVMMGGMGGGTRAWSVKLARA